MYRKMIDYIEEFSQQMVQALEIGKAAKFTKRDRQYNNVMVVGLGGSGIGGTIVAQLLKDELPIPLCVNKDYELPAFIDDKTLLIVSSYSGNTEETLSAMEVGLKKGAEIACITSGGKVLEMAKEHDLNHIVIPSGIPPRGSFGINSPQLLFHLHRYGLIGDGFIAEVEKSIALLNDNDAAIRAEGKAIAEQIHGTIPILYADSSFNGVCVRIRQQINENSKQLCWHHVFPEMNHNELVGWAGGDERVSVLMLRTKQDHDRTKVRMDLCKKIFSDKAREVVEIWAKGESIIQRSYYLIYLGDWISWYLSDLNGVDAVEVNIIDYLKGELAKLN